MGNFAAISELRPEPTLPSHEQRRAVPDSAKDQDIRTFAKVGPPMDASKEISARVNPFRSMISSELICNPCEPGSEPASAFNAAKASDA